VKDKKKRRKMTKKIAEKKFGEKNDNNIYENVFRKKNSQISEMCKSNIKRVFHFKFIQKMCSLIS